MLLNEAAAAQGGGLGSFLPFILIIGLFAVMYFVMIRPQSKRRKEMQEMQRALDVGSYITTIGGLYGRVVSTSDEAVTLQISPLVTATYTRQAVAKSIPATDLPEAVLNAIEYDEPDAADESDDSADTATATETVALSKDASSDVKVDATKDADDSADESADESADKSTLTDKAEATDKA